MAEYFGHWLDIGGHGGSDALPRIFYVNWFRKDDDGRFLWPGFGENSRVLAWIFRRCEGTAEAVDTPIGRVPAPGSLDVEGLDLDPAALETLLGVDEEAVTAELPQVEQHLARFGDDLPGPVRAQLDALKARLR
jgi:phosphoenolpyruvate carboxykinase (GTP)